MPVFASAERAWSARQPDAERACRMKNQRRLDAAAQDRQPLRAELARTAAAQVHLAGAYFHASLPLRAPAAASAGQAPAAASEGQASGLARAQAAPCTATRGWLLCTAPGCGCLPVWPKGAGACPWCALRRESRFVLRSPCKAQGCQQSAMCRPRAALRALRSCSPRTAASTHGRLRCQAIMRMLTQAPHVQGQAAQQPEQVLESQDYMARAQEAAGLRSTLQQLQASLRCDGVASLGVRSACCNGGWGAAAGDACFSCAMLGQCVACKPSGIPLHWHGECWLSLILRPGSVHSALTWASLTWGLLRRQEQQILAELQHCLTRQILTPLQAAKVALASIPQRINYVTLCELAAPPRRS